MADKFNGLIQEANSSAKLIKNEINKRINLSNEKKSTIMV